MIIPDALANETLRELATAQGPLTIREIAERLSARHHGVVTTTTVRTRLMRLYGLGLVLTYAETIGGVRSRFYWPTPLGRQEAP